MSSSLASTHAAAVSESICDGPTYANDRPATAPDLMSAIAVIADDWKLIWMDAFAGWMMLFQGSAAEAFLAQ